MRYFPAFMDLQGQTVLLSGGGELALRKARLLLPSGARIIAYSASEDGPLAQELGHLVIRRKEPLGDTSFSDDPKLIVAATGDEAEDERVARLCRVHKVPVNAVDMPEFCDVVIPSMVSRGDLVVGISTGGAAPVVGRRLREKLEAMLPAKLGDVISFAKTRRGKVEEALEPRARRAFWERFYTGRAPDAVMEGREADADQLFDQELRAETPGQVHIVGAGPGDPELLTIKALRVCQEADVILHDNLVSDEILALCRRDATRIYVGKKRSEHAVPQAEIGALIAKLAKDGQRVVRLKGGDPFIFGRGGEELEALHAEGLTATVVPGITAALGCAATSEVPLTHRGLSQSVTFITAEAGGGGAPDIDWASLAKLKGTIAVYMGVRRAGDVADDLMVGGLDASTPVAVIADGTRDTERVIRASLGTLGEAASHISAPGLLVIGAVAAKAKGEDLLALQQQRPAA